VTASAVLAFGLAQLFSIPLHGLWAVLTAVMVTQINVGGSAKATADYAIGTLCGVVYAGAVADLVPHTTALATAGVLALAIAPLAYAATLSPSFRVAPFTAVLVLLISVEIHQTPIASASYRLLEVAIGGAVAMAVSVLIFPARAYLMRLHAAAQVLERLARALPVLLQGFQTKVDPLQNERVQDDIGKAVNDFESIAEEAQRERSISFVNKPDPAALGRTLLRLRHDLVMIGRAASNPFPEPLADCLAPMLAQVAATTRDYFLASASALTGRRSPPSVEPIETSIAAYESEMTSIRAEGLLQSLPTDKLERVFVLGFVLQQLRRNLSDLARCLQEGARTMG